MKNIYMILLFIIFCSSFNVYALPTSSDFGEGQGPGANESTGVFIYNVSIDTGDYELTCIYSDGAQLTITREEIYITNTSNSINASSNSEIKFYLTSDQHNKRDTNGKVITSNASKLLNGYKCPTQLYLYKVDSTKDREDDKEGLDGVYNYYYSTKKGIEGTWGSNTTGALWWKETTNNAQPVDDKKIVLVSEEVNLTTSKKAMICDYQTIGSSSIGTQTASLYIYNNASFLEVGNRITTLTKKHTKCPAALTAEEIEKGNLNKTYLVVNEPNTDVLTSISNADTYEYVYKLIDNNYKLDKIIKNK